MLELHNHARRRNQQLLPKRLWVDSGGSLAGQWCLQPIITFCLLDFLKKPPRPCLGKPIPSNEQTCGFVAAG